MKDEYDFSKGKRGRLVPEPPSEKGKVKITIRLDEDLLDHFGAIADASGGKPAMKRSSTLLSVSTSKAKPPKSRTPCAASFPKNSQQTTCRPRHNPCQRRADRPLLLLPQENFLCRTRRLRQLSSFDSELLCRKVDRRNDVIALINQNT